MKSLADGSLRALVLFTCVIATNFAFANNYYQLDPSHAHNRTIDLSNMKEIFNKGRMQIYQLKDKKNLLPGDLNISNLLKKNSWKVISPIENQQASTAKQDIIDLIKQLNESNVRTHLEYFTATTHVVLALLAIKNQRPILRAT